MGFLCPFSYLLTPSSTISCETRGKPVGKFDQIDFEFDQTITRLNSIKFLSNFVVFCTKFSLSLKFSQIFHLGRISGQT